MSKLNQLETQWIDNPGDHDIQQNMAKIKAELEISEIEKVKGAQIRAGCKDINEGEKCTRYFLSLEKSRSENNVIKRLKSSNDQYVYGEAEIVEEIANQFETKYNNSVKSYDETSQLFDEYISGVKLPTLDEREQQECDKHITEGEVLSALRKMKEGSSPGCDGLPVEFFRMFWRQLKGPLLKSYLYSFEQRHLSYSERVGVITLIHKGKDLPTYTLSNWRPLSLTNCDYKILAKVFSMKTDKVIDKLIGEQQTGFMSGRNISVMHGQIDEILYL